MNCRPIHFLFACSAIACLASNAQAPDHKQSVSHRTHPSIARDFIRLRLAMSESDVAFGDKHVSVSVGEMPVGGRDYQALEKLADGEIVQLAESNAFKFRTDLNVRFGDLEIRPNNVAENYRGMYSLWLRKTTDGWRLIFNDLPDVWGTQHDPKADRGDTAVVYSKAQEPTTKLNVAVLKHSDTEGAVRITWGAHQWTASFTPAK